MVYFPHYCDAPFNEFHREVFAAYDPDARGIRDAWGAPRGNAKSTIITTISVCHDVAYGLEKFVILLSATKSLTIQKIKSIRGELLTNTRLVADFGIYFPNKRPGETQFEVMSKCGSALVMAFSRGTELRGITYGQHRPTKIICDDIEDSEKVFNEEIRIKDRNWYYEVVSKIGDAKTNIYFVGTVIHRDSLLKNVMANPAYRSQMFKSVKSWALNEGLWQEWREIYTNLDLPDRLEQAAEYYKNNESAMLEGTEVLWPEREPYLFLMKEMVEIGRRAFMKEKQNEPLGAEDKIFETMHWYKETADGILIEKTGKVIEWDALKPTAIGVVDPATGRTTKKGKLGDFTCILTGYTEPKGRLLVHNDWTKRAAPTKYIREIFELHDNYQYNKFGVETNLYRELLLPNLVAERKDREKQRRATIQLPFYDIENHTQKEARIAMVEPKVTHGWVLFNRALSQEFISQVEDFPHADHDDCPDALEMLWNLHKGAYKASALSVDLMGAR